MSRRLLNVFSLIRAWWRVDFSAPQASSLSNSFSLSSPVSLIYIPTSQLYQNSYEIAMHPTLPVCHHYFSFFLCACMSSLLGIKQISQKMPMWCKADKRQALKLQIKWSNLVNLPSLLKLCEVTPQRNSRGFRSHHWLYRWHQSAVKSISVSSGPADLRSYYLAVVDMPRG